MIPRPGAQSTPREKVLSWIIFPGRIYPACSFLMSGLHLIWTRRSSRNEETIYFILMRTVQ
jgi:hypothetical protein